MKVITSPVTFVHRKQELYKTHTNLLATIHNSVVNVKHSVSNTSVLQDVVKNQSKYQKNEHNILNVEYPPDTENSSDSGIEDIETLESSSDDMDSLGLKRKRRRKVFEGFHTGDEIIDAFKSKSKVKIGSAKVEDKETGINKLEKENIVTADEVSDVIVNTTKRRKAKLKSAKTGTGPNQNGDKSAPEKACVISTCENVNLEYFSNGTHCKRKRVEVKKDVETTKATSIGEEHRPNKKAKQDVSGTNTSKVSYTKIKDCKTSEKNKPGLSSDKSGSEEDKIDKYIKRNQIEETVNDSTKFKRDPKDQFCIICEKANGEMIPCSGTCLHQFHANCLGLNFIPTGNFTCDECTTGYPHMFCVSPSW